MLSRLVDQMKLNKTAAAVVRVPKGKTDHIAWDEDVPGFGLRVREGGSRTWVFRYRLGSKQRVMTFGSAEVMSAQQAREQAQRLHAQVKLGLDPAGGKIESQARATEIFEYAVKIFLTRQKERLKPRSFLEAERHLLMHARPLHPRPLAKIERRDIAIRLNEIANASGPAAANRVRTSLSALYAWAIAKDWSSTIRLPIPTRRSSAARVSACSTPASCAQSGMRCPTTTSATSSSCWR